MSTRRDPAGTAQKATGAAPLPAEDREVLIPLSVEDMAPNPMRHTPIDERQRLTDLTPFELIRVARFMHTTPWDLLAHRAWATRVIPAYNAWLETQHVTITADPKAVAEQIAWSIQ